jgi:hypothetical protein
VDRRAIRFWAVRAGLGWLVPITAQLIWLALAGGGGAQLGWLLATVLVAAAHVTVMPWWRFRVHRWEVTGSAVYTQAGWLRQERRIAPLSRVQTVDSERGPLEQLFGLANVTVTTASGRGPVRIHGLSAGTTDRLVDELTAAVQHGTTQGLQDAT